MSSLKSKIVELVSPIADRLAALDEKITAAGAALTDAATAHGFAALLASEDPTNEAKRADVDAAAAVVEEKKKALNELQAARSQLVTMEAQLTREAAEREADRKRRAIASAGCHKFAVRFDELLASMRETVLELYDREQQAVSVGGDLHDHFRDANLHVEWLVSDALAVHPSFGFHKKITSPRKKLQELFTTDALLEAAKLK